MPELVALWKIGSVVFFFNFSICIIYGIPGIYIYITKNISYSYCSKTMAISKYVSIKAFFLYVIFRVKARTDAGILPMRRKTQNNKLISLGGGGYNGFTLSVCLYVCLTPFCGHDFVYASSKKWVNDFFWKFVHSLLTTRKCAPGIFI